MKKRKNSYNYLSTLSNFIGGWAHNVAEGGLVGVEIEVEGTNLPRMKIPGWSIHEDGSLRGESAEYVFTGAATIEDVQKRLEALATALHVSKCDVRETYRTSVHVHLNARDMLIKDIFTQAMLYIVYEDILADIAGKERIGNLFCLRAKDAEYLLECMRKAIKDDYINNVMNDNLRYSAINMAALARHGTLEYRAFRGTVDMQLIQQWVDLLLATRNAAINVFENPIQIVEDISKYGPYDFTKRIFSDEQIRLFGDGWEDKLFEGIRLVQHAAYASDWAPKPAEKASKNNIYTSVTDTIGVEFADLNRVVRAARNRMEANNGVQWGLTEPAPRPVPQVQFAVHDDVAVIDDDFFVPFENEEEQ